MDIKCIDPNMVINEEFETNNLEFYSIKSYPFKIFGVSFSDKENIFLRMPLKYSKKVSEGVFNLSKTTAGGRIRFKCNSNVYAIITKQPLTHKVAIMSCVAANGFDLYVNNVYNRTFRCPENLSNTGYKSRVDVERYENKMNDITINFPPFSQVEDVLIGVKKGSVIEECSPYKNEKPVIFYGSSITHGASASRPGNSYENIVSRKLDMDYVNLGFSGQAKAEDEMADYINTLDMSCFVYDYDHNAKTLKDLEATHWKFFEKIRKSNPDLPIIMASRPLYYLNETELKRRDHIMGNYLKAKSNGDNNVYFVDGSLVTEHFGKHDATCDGVHPNDLGFYGMADAFSKILGKILK